MSTRLLDRTARPGPAPTAAPPRAPDRAYDAVAKLTRLRNELLAALDKRRYSRWKEPPVFFFDPHRQAELRRARPSAPAGPLVELTASIVAVLPDLFASVEVRRVARALQGLQAAAQSLADDCPPARDLVELLAIPEDEVIVVLAPDRRAGLRLLTRGIVDVGQFHILLAGAVAGDVAADFLPGPSVAERFIAASQAVHPVTPAGVPMVAEARYQLLVPTALGPDGKLPVGFAGCEHWLWPAMPLAALPRINGERVVLVGPPAFAMTWDVNRRFPALSAEVRLLEMLSPYRVAERLSQLTGRTIAPQPATLSKAA